MVRLTAMLLAASMLVACTSAKPKTSHDLSSAQGAVGKETVSGTQKENLPDLAKAMNKLEAEIEKPTAPFHVSFTKSQSNGLLYQCEADISSDGIVGQQTDHTPDVEVGSDLFPANTRVRRLNGMPPGTLDWSTVRGGMVMTFLSGQIGDAQDGVKYANDEQAGGFDTRRYDFDLAGIDATIKRAMITGNAGGGRQVKDFNIKGSAWIAKATDEMVKFHYETIYVFADSGTDVIGYDGLVTRK